MRKVDLDVLLTDVLSSQRSPGLIPHFLIKKKQNIFVVKTFLEGLDIGAHASYNRFTTPWNMSIFRGHLMVFIRTSS